MYAQARFTSRDAAIRFIRDCQNADRRVWYVPCAAESLFPHRHNPLYRSTVHIVEWAVLPVMDIPRLLVSELLFI